MDQKGCFVSSFVAILKIVCENKMPPLIYVLRLINGTDHFTEMVLKNLFFRCGETKKLIEFSILLDLICQRKYPYTDQSIAFSSSLFCHFLCMLFRSRISSISKNNLTLKEK